MSPILIPFHAGTHSSQNSSCQGHHWPSFCQIKRLFFPVFNSFDDLLQLISLFLEAAYLLHSAPEINHYLGSSIILLVFSLKLFNDLISLRAKAKVLTMAHKALFFSSSLFALQILFYNHSVTSFLPAILASLFFMSRPGMLLPQSFFTGSSSS